jgi:TrmH family RNA methyltransferase
MSGIAPVALSSKNDQLKQLRRLVRQAKVRSAERAFVVDGPTLVAEVLRSSLTVRAVFAGDDAALDALRSLSDDPRAGRQLAMVPVFRVDTSVLTAVLDPASPRPIAAVVETPQWSLTDVAGDRPVMVAVELRDPGNVGTLVRSCEAAGCGATIVVGHSVDHLNPKAVRASAGSVLRLPVLTVPDLAQAVASLRETGRSVVATVVRPDAVPYEQVDLRSAAILVGNEPHGLPLEAVSMADTAVTIPMAPGVESLNVAAAGAILAFEAARQRRQDTRRPDQEPADDGGLRRRPRP